MKILIILLNRTYQFLTKVKNQSPLLGASFLVAIVLWLFVNNIFLFIYAFKSVPLSDDNWIMYTLLIFIILLVYTYARIKKLQIADATLFSGMRNNLFVGIIYVFIVSIFIFLANINRDKIFKLDKKTYSSEPRKKSLEGQIRKWFD